MYIIYKIIYIKIKYVLNINFLVYFLSGILIFSAFMVIISQHSVFSLLFLVLSFISSSFLLFLLECEFLALIFIVVYVGAIAVLFLFAVMMLDAKLQNLSRNIFKYLPAGFLFGLIFLVPLLHEIFIQYNLKDYLLSYSNFQNEARVNWYSLMNSINDVEVYGQVLYSYFVLQFLVVGLILLVVLLGVVYFTNTYNSKHSIDQSIFKQLSVSSKFFH